MFSKLAVLFITLTLVSANFFNLFNNFGHGGNREGRAQNPEEHENAMLNGNCGRYLCPDTGICVDAPKFCPCPFPSSQLRCFLPDGRYLCISKPAGEIAANYDDAATNWKVDAKDDNVRDCGWVNRAWKGEV
ncbi:long chronological lifespan protein 2 [Suhomyces tanzawaensis NRRL Y-17324]|uniref:Long chronological lifespan protein 2 n=1 Tax=Suhomyces tanzawaensis NRRL Y-17324 TaxID=984487 RepID=A0A1E4SKU7_9ASCO|nr:long chronological lifespan protein 2 [Suhomyces tanzawaensis NRRL Y-17324]ODV80129.1 long chronological lifespan protein 2 [Suhomyces tanzawaensis NRRL Y-17324]